MLELQTANKNKRIKNGGDGITALYCRLSVDDNGNEGESNSIKNQRDILGRYAKQHGYRNIRYYIDDGYSGTNFNRPDFQKMMIDVDEDKVKTIIVKDMSRLGRDYLKVGYLTEFTFAEKEATHIEKLKLDFALADYDGICAFYKNALNNLKAFIKKHSPECKNNYYCDRMVLYARRINKLIELDAPKFIIENEKYMFIDSVLLYKTHAVGELIEIKK